MSYLIRMSQHQGVDHAECEWNGQTFKAASTHGANMALARLLVAAGAPDGPWIGVDYRSGAKRLLGRSLHTLSGMSVQDSRLGTPRFVRYRPQPPGLHAPARQAEAPASAERPSGADPPGAPCFRATSPRGAPPEPHVAGRDLDVDTVPK